MGKFLKIIILVIFSVSVLVSCGDGERKEAPFEYRFTSNSSAVITYKGRQYVLTKYRENENVPFEYEFEDDGDLYITIEGVEYDLDSPFDYDRPKSKKLSKAQKQQAKRVKAAKLAAKKAKKAAKKKKSYI